MAILGVEPDRVDDVVADLEDEDLSVRPSSFRKGLMACTGIEFCKLALTETKGRAMWIAQELEERLPDFDESVRIHVNGCPNSCARFQIADIGLMGAIQPRPDGTRAESFLVHLGGGLGEGGGFGRKVRGVRVLAEDAADYVETLLIRYRHRGNGHASFGAFVRSLSDPQLADFARWDR
jgi:sulfite reductase (ferredoxin)